MMDYQSVVEDAVTEKIIEKSRFLSYISHTETEESAKAFLEKIRAMHPLATHVCYGYIADSVGNLQRFSDDGEPQGTAGMPILGVLKAQKLYETAIAVVRYFGGIKLGAGGLTRAYAGGAADVCKIAKIKTFSLGVEIEILIDYPLVNAALKFLEGEIVLSRTFESAARFCVIVKEQNQESFCARAREALNGRAELKIGAKYVYPF